MTNVWKKISSAPRDKRILVLCDSTGEFCVASFERLSNAQAVYGWVVVTTVDGKKVIARSSPTHWSYVKTPALKPAKAKALTKRKKR